MSSVNSKLQEVYEMSSTCQGKFCAEVAPVSDAQARFKPSPDRWGIGELAHHVGLIQKRVLGIAEKLLAQAEQENLGPDPDPTSALHSMDQFAEKGRAKIQAPPDGIPEFGRPIERSLQDLERQDAHLRELLPRLSARDLSRLKSPHFVFGDLNIYQWILLLGGHCLRHRKQIQGLKGHPEFPKNG